MTPGPFLTLGEVQEKLRISRRSVYRLIRAGRLRVVHPTPGRTVIERTDVDAYIRWLRDAA